MIDTESAMLFSHSYSQKDLLRHILIASPSSKPKDALYRTALIMLLQDGNGMRELRSILEKHGNDRTWYRIAADARENAELLDNLESRSWHKQIEKALTTYNPLKLDVIKVKYSNMKTMENKEYFTAKELAEKLSLNVMTIYRYIDAGKLSACKIGKEFRIEKKDFDEFMSKAKSN